MEPQQQPENIPPPTVTSTKHKRQIPQSELDLNMMTINTEWGSPHVSPELRSRLAQVYKYKDKDGKETIVESSKWGLLSYYTRDLRFGNLSRWDNELATCQYHLNLAGDFLHENMDEPFLICLQRVATILELSQSKGGFFRKMMNTFRQELSETQEEPPKKSLFGMGKKQDNYGR